MDAHKDNSLMRVLLITSKITCGNTYANLAMVVPALLILWVAAYIDAKGSIELLVSGRNDHTEERITAF